MTERDALPAISYTTTMGAPRLEVWEFVRDIDNWAPFTRGYQSHELLNDRESLWVVRGDYGLRFSVANSLDNIKLALDRVEEWTKKNL